MPSLSRPGIYAIVSILAAAWPIIRRLLTGTLDIFEPILSGCVMLLILFGIRPLVMLSTGDITYEHMIDVHAEFNRATLIGMLATISFVVGYEIVRSVRVTRLKVPSRSLDYSATTRAVTWLAAGGALAFLFRLALAGNPLTTLDVLVHGRSLAATTTQISSFLSDGPLLAACGATILVIAVRGRPTASHHDCSIDHRAAWRILATRQPSTNLAVRADPAYCRLYDSRPTSSVATLGHLVPSRIHCTGNNSGRAITRCTRAERWGARDLWGCL
jgi:hypothetical protein